MALAGPTGSGSGEPPAGAVGGVSDPAAGTLKLSLEASDEGLGLLSASASLQGAPTVTASFGGEPCAQLAQAAQAGEPIAPSLEGACPADVSGVPLTIDTTKVPDGEHMLVVSVSDAEGNVTTLLEEAIVVENTPPSYESSVTIALGNGKTEASSGETGDTGGSGRVSKGGDNGRGETLGFSSTHRQTCASPRLSMMLAQRPLRTARGVVVLHDRAYRYRGQLTCLVSGKRKRAAAGTTIAVDERVGRRSVARSGTTVRRTGWISVLLVCPSTRTIVFTAPGGGHSAIVRIPVEVVRAHGKGSR
ncbi:MAG TPA: hypothetical protein VGF95_00355 [Solirubrobacteraceae bacterium]|jgi:hypothetical protein